MRYSGTELLARLCWKAKTKKNLAPWPRISPTRSVRRSAASHDSSGSQRRSRRDGAPSAARRSPRSGSSGAAWPRKPAPTASPYICAKIAGIFKSATSSGCVSKITTKINLEMAVTPAMVAFAEKIRPDDACFVPEKREELTTEGGLDVVAHKIKVKDAVKNTARSRHSRQLVHRSGAGANRDSAKKIGAHAIEIHTGAYCNASPRRAKSELRAIADAASLARRLGSGSARRPRPRL